jgi:hypothetical protein
MGIRDGRHPVGEYMLTPVDLKNKGKFDDVAFVRKSQLRFKDSKFSGGNGPRDYDVPYRSFLPKNVDNLLLTGNCLSFNHEMRMKMKGIPMSIRSGEVAGEAAVLSIKQGITPKKLKWNKPLTD